MNFGSSFDEAMQGCLEERQHSKPAMIDDIVPSCRAYGLNNSSPVTSLYADSAELVPTQMFPIL